MNLTSLLISLISGVVGGNVLGAAWKDKTLGALGNSIAGAIGGVAGSYITLAVGLLNTVGLDQLTVGAVIGNIGSSAVGGAILTAIVGAITSAIGKKA